MDKLTTFLNGFFKLLGEIATSLYELINRIFEGKILTYLWQIIIAFGHMVVGVLEALLKIFKTYIK